MGFKSFVIYGEHQKVGDDKSVYIYFDRSHAEIQKNLGGNKGESPHDNCYQCGDMSYNLNRGRVAMFRCKVSIEIKIHVVYN